MKKKDFIFIFLLLVLIILFLYKIVFFRQTFFLGDLMYYFQPWTCFSAEGIQRGWFWLWNPYLSNGQPLLANIQVSLFYPLKILFYGLSFVYAYKIYLIIHFFLAGLFVYLLLRHWQIDRVGSILASIIYTFSGYLIVQVEFLSVLGSVVWVSLLFLLGDKALQTKKSFYWLMVCLALTMQFFAGYTFIFFYTVISLFLYIIFKTWSEKNFKIYLIFLVVVILVAGLAAVQFLPTLEMMKYSTRASFQFAETSTWSLPPLFLIKFIMPDLFGKACLPLFFPQPFGTEYWAIKQYWLNTFYIGILPLIFIILAFRAKNKKLLFFILLLFLSLMLSMSATLPFTKYYYQYFPLARVFTHPASFMFLGMLCLVIFFAFGWQYFITQKPKLGVLLLLGLLLGIVGLWFVLNTQIFTKIISRCFVYKITQDQHQWIKENYLGYFVRLLMSLFLIWLISKYKLNRIIKILISLFIIGDLFYFGIHMNIPINHEFFTDKIPRAILVREHLNSGRIFFEPDSQTTKRQMSGTTWKAMYFSLREVLQPNTGIVYHVPYIHGYEYLQIKPYKDLLWAARSRNSIFDSAILDMLGARFIFSYFVLSSPKLKKVGEDLIQIYENKNYLPKAWLVTKSKFLPRETILNYLKNDMFNPAQEVVIEEPSFSDTRQEDTTQAIQIIADQPDRIIVKTKTNSPRWLVLNDIYYPGWQAQIDGKDTKIYRANYILKAIRVGAGIHQIRFEYYPNSFKKGLGLSIFLFLLLVTYGILFTKSHLPISQ